MSTKVELIFSGDAKGAISAVEALERAEKKHAAELKDIDQAQKKVEASAFSVASAYGAVSGAMASIGVGVLASNLYQVNAEFGQLRASLLTVTGSLPQANAEFERLQAFAADTPYKLTEVVTAFNRLAALNLDASTASMTSYGNTAAATGKSMIDMIEAVADASTGEFERLRDFGITAKSEGDKVIFTFRGVSTEVGKNAGEIQGYLLEIGKTTFASGMSNQMKEIVGAASNLADQYDALLSTMGKDIPIKEGLSSATAALKLLTDNLDAATVGMTAFAATGTIAGFSAMSGWLSRIAMTAAGLVAVKAALAGIVGMGTYMATKKVLSWGDDEFFGGELGYSEKKLKEAQARSEAIRKLNEKNAAATAAAMNVGPAGLGSDALAKLREEQEKAQAKAVKAGEDALKSYSSALKDVGREQLKLAESGFASDMKRQAEYFERTGTAASNLSAPLQSYLSVIDQIYGAQKQGQEAVLATMVQIGATDAARVQQEINISTVEKTMLEERKKAWGAYASDVEKLVGTAWDNLAKKEEAWLQSRKMTQELAADLDAKANPKQEKDQFTAYLEDKDRAQDLERRALATTNLTEKIRLMTEAQQAYAKLGRGVVIDGAVIVDEKIAAADAAAKIKELGDAKDVLHQKEIAQAAEQLQNLTTVKAEAEAAITALDTAITTLDTKLATMTLRSITVDAKDQATAVITPIQTALDQLKDKTITITTKYVSNVPGKASPLAGEEDHTPGDGVGPMPQNPGRGLTPFGKDIHIPDIGERAAGGPVAPFGTYLVGERGPEILKMGSQGGNVIPNNQLGGSTNVTVNIAINAPNLNKLDEKSTLALSKTLAPEIGRILKERFR